jgi:flagellar biosynthesis protein FlhB
MLQGMMDTWPVVTKNNCFLFPSQPELLKSRLEFIMPRLARNNMFSTKIILNADKEALLLLRLFFSTQFTCFTGTTVQILTLTQDPQEALSQHLLSLLALLVLKYKS